VPFTKEAVETFVSDRVTKVTECNVADLRAELPSAQDWVSGFGLMVKFVNQPAPEWRPFALQFVRRSEMAVSEYCLARDALLDLLSGSRGRWSPYFRALYHFEAAVSQLYQAFDFSRKVLKTTLFAKGDGSPLARLNRINNIIKHQVAAEEQPVWISNRGIETAEVTVLFSEMEDLIRSCARIATKLTSTPPKEGQNA
jgi:hypothetical protein